LELEGIEESLSLVDAAWPFDGVLGKGLHSSTFQLNLSRF
jgi:hypothetical protein